MLKPLSLDLFLQRNPRSWSRGGDQCCWGRGHFFHHLPTLLYLWVGMDVFFVVELLKMLVFRCKVPLKSGGEVLWFVSLPFLGGRMNWWFWKWQDSVDLWVRVGGDSDGSSNYVCPMYIPYEILQHRMGGRQSWMNLKSHKSTPPKNGPEIDPMKESSSWQGPSITKHLGVGFPLRKPYIQLI